MAIFKGKFEKFWVQSETEKETSKERDTNRQRMKWKQTK
jgi:hypothetical protein